MTRKEKFLTFFCTALTVLLLACVVKISLSDEQHRKDSLLLEGLYAKSFYDTLHEMRGLDTNMTKLSVAFDEQMQSKLLSDIWRQADNLQSNLSQLPSSFGPTNSTLQFINQLGDYCRILDRKLMEGGTLSARDEEQLLSLQAQLDAYHNQYYTLSQRILDGDVKLLQLYGDNFDEFTDFINEFTQLEEQNSQYPALIYDGPFSASTQEHKWLALPENELTSDEAMTAAQEFLQGLGEAEITYSDMRDGSTPVYVFSVTIDDRTGYIEVTKRGGKILSFSLNIVEEGDKDLAACQDIALAFLEDRGFTDLQSAYEQHDNYTFILNFAVKQDGVTLYPDLIKIKVCRAKGKVVGFEAFNYLNNHQERTLPTDIKSEAEVLAEVPDKFTVETVRLALIPLETGEEVLTYELTGLCNEQTFVVYLNAKTLMQEQVFQIINADEGSFVL